MGCIYGLIVAFLFIFISFALGLFRLLFGAGRATRRFIDEATGNSRQGSASASSQRQSSSTDAGSQSAAKGSRGDKNGRFFDKNEGDYVDFEEVKE